VDVQLTASGQLAVDPRAEEPRADPLDQDRREVRQHLRRSPIHPAVRHEVRLDHQRPNRPQRDLPHLDRRGSSIWVASEHQVDQSIGRVAELHEPRGEPGAFLVVFEDELAMTERRQDPVSLGGEIGGRRRSHGPLDAEEVAIPAAREPVVEERRSEPPRSHARARRLLEPSREGEDALPVSGPVSGPVSDHEVRVATRLAAGPGCERD
jgi:hypothetical protein